MYIGYTQSKCLKAIDAFADGDIDKFKHQRDLIGAGVFLDLVEQGWATITLTPEGMKVLAEVNNGK